MGNTTVLRDVNETIKKLLKDNIAELSDENAIIFDSPGEIDPVSSPKLSVFLYRIAENAYLRNTEPQPLGHNQLEYPPLSLDLYYIFTPYAPNRETEILILESLMQVFLDNAVFRDDMLQGNLTASGNDIIRITPYSLSLDDLNKLWSTFPNKAFKLLSSYIVTPVKIPSGKPPSDITRVVDREMGYYSMEE